MQDYQFKGQPKIIAETQEELCEKNTKIKEEMEMPKIWRRNEIKYKEKK